MEACLQKYDDYIGLGTLSEKDQSLEILSAKLREIAKKKAILPSAIVSAWNKTVLQSAVAAKLRKYAGTHADELQAIMCGKTWFYYRQTRSREFLQKVHELCRELGITPAGENAKK